MTDAPDRAGISDAVLRDRCPEIAGRRHAARPCTEAGARVLHLAAKRTLLLSIPMARENREGAEDIDLEVQSEKRWRRWCDSLADAEKRLLLRWRCGAVCTPTRRWSALSGPGRAACPHCGAPRASARHLWAECPGLAALRARLDVAYRVPLGWQSQPRVTAKSGWVVMGAGPTIAQRAEWQIAAGRLGMAIVSAADLYFGPLFFWPRRFSFGPGMGAAPAAQLDFSAEHVDAPDVPVPAWGVFAERDDTTTGRSTGFRGGLSSAGGLVC